MPEPSRLIAVPDQPGDDVYGWVEYMHDTRQPPRRLSIGVCFCWAAWPDTDIVIDAAEGEIVRHPYSFVPRKSTEEERAAVGWTW